MLSEDFTGQCYENFRDSYQAGSLPPETPAPFMHYLVSLMSISSVVVALIFVRLVCILFLASYVALLRVLSFEIIFACSCFCLFVLVSGVNMLALGDSNLYLSKTSCGGGIITLYRFVKRFLVRVARTFASIRLRKEFESRA